VRIGITSASKLRKNRRTGYVALWPAVLGERRRSTVAAEPVLRTL
jgi:hypothetical protein